MKSIPGSCKICGVILHLQIDECYPIEHDPMKLISMATCDRCYDLRDRRIKIESHIKRLCYRLEMGRLDDAERGKLLDMLKVLAKKFSMWCADMLRRQHSANVGFLVQALIDQPTRWYNHLRDFETAVNQ